MFKNAYQSGFLSILFAGGSKPLGIWGEEVRNGHIRRVTDEDVQTLALELMGTNVATTFIICPAGKKDTLGIRLPFFIMIVKNMKKYFTFEITVLGSCYIETLRVQIHANVRIRRIYFSDRLYAEDEMPQEFKLYVPISSKKDKEAKTVTVEEKSTGADKVRVSASAEPRAEEIKEEEPSGAPPTPTETVREPALEAAPEHVQEAPAPKEASEAAPSEAPAEAAEAAEGEPAAEEDAGGEAPGEEAPEDAEAYAEEAFEETPAEDALAEEAPAEDAPAAEAPAEEAPAEEGPAEGSPAEEPPTE